VDFVGYYYSIAKSDWEARRLNLREDPFVCLWATKIGDFVHLVVGSRMPLERMPLERLRVVLMPSSIGGGGVFVSEELGVDD
jgi:hypothetical protein